MIKLKQTSGISITIYDYFNLVLLLLAFGLQATAQNGNVGIGTPTPDPSAVLELRSSDKGILIPRMTSAQRAAIAAPATGLLVFDTNTAGFWFYNGSEWTDLSSPGTGTSTSIADTDGNTKIQVEETSNDNVIRFDINGVERMWLQENAAGFTPLQFGNRRHTLIGQGAGVNMNVMPSIPDPLDGNTFLGFWAGHENTTGTMNTGIGVDALKSNINGWMNTAIGHHALSLNQSNDNTAVGHLALSFNGVGKENTATGSNALVNNRNGDGNTATGFSALKSNSSGYDNTAIGANAMFNGSTGNRNTALGFSALRENTIGSANTASGDSSLLLNTIGILNTAIGHRALPNNTSGRGNTAVGPFTLSTNGTGNWNTAIGTAAFTVIPNLDNTTCLGVDAGHMIFASNRVAIGNTSVSWIGGQVGWSTYSDARIKTQVEENVPGLSFISRLRPVTYHLDIHKQNELFPRDSRDKMAEADWPTKYDIEKKQMTGFIAQEVAQAARELGYDFSGVEKAGDEVGLYSVRYAQFVVPLVKAVQEQQTLIGSLTNRLEASQVAMEDLQSERNELKSRLDRLEAAMLQRAESTPKTPNK
ncbi:tail fiber domain-containing protein [Flavilitoribacter nigricans]|uniref:Peptidase S74 domain-containing protein n=1 Tax=Flavilitoribacter nigricans (strain ATCC 23147 / DSM 23189 / NBRC 102662 / NCIMB 1420 / SS-2) TaxID=1122177 RepID=A0A2D0N3D0_FLAN2|nr:tail fiber domain-containing protein [Flavilitoribacter nigricans]PHN02898.1 hypothetical protein CRP01_29255 [Flavilitoribacter nigricans DSM 23189 = NBRC 102662]